LKVKRGFTIRLKMHCEKVSYVMLSCTGRCFFETLTQVGFAVVV
jgi:hypothetical protein